MALVIAHAELVSDQTSDPRTAPQRRREAVRLGAFQQQRLEAFELRGVQQRLTAGAAGLAQPGFAVTPVSSQPLADALPRDLQSPRCLGLTTALLDQPDRFETALLQGLEIPPYAFCISHTYKDVRTPKRCHFILRDSIGGSYRWLTQFLGGGYMELSPEGDAGGGFRLRPFSLPAGERTFGFLAGWIARLLRIGGWTLGGEDPSEIRARVEDLYAFAPQRRTLGVLVRSLPSKMWPALGRWHGDGAWGRYFDNAADGEDLNFEDWQVIDMAGAAEHDDLCEAALFYLLERLRLSLENPDETARVKLMVVDEAWRYLQDPAVLSYLAEAAKTWRKKNAALVIATQSAVDVTGTAGAEALLESMPTKLFLANPELPDKAADTFRLNPSEVNTIRGLIPKRELYLRRTDAAGILRLEVDPASYWLYTSSPVDAHKRAEAVRKYGLTEAIEHLSRR